MTSANKAILEALGRWFNGKAELDEREGYCLGFVTSVLREALALPIPEFYDRYVRERADPVEHWVQDEPWARDVQKSLRALGMGVEKPEPGDLLFVWRDAKSETWTAREGHEVYIGHVGVLLAPGGVLENVRAAWRPQSFNRGEIQFTPLAWWQHRFDAGQTPVIEACRFDPGAARP